MNSKELLEQAEERASSIRNISAELRNIEKAFEAAQSGIIGILNRGEYIWLHNVMGIDKAEDVSRIVRVKLTDLINEKSAELEKLLGIRKPATLNPEFEAAVMVMENSLGVTSGTISEDAIHTGELLPDPVEAKLTNIIQGEIKRIEDKPIIPEKSLAKYPAKKNAYPEGMTKEVVRKMYIDELKTIAYIAKHFGVTYTKAANFISYYKLHRTHYDKTVAPAKKPDETERP